MSKKSDLVAALIKEVKLRHPMPSGPTEGLNLLEQGAVIVLLRHMTQKQAEQSVKALKGAFEDWNEVRVCQAQEISEFLRHGGRKKGVALLHDRREAAMALKEYLQDVFQETDALDLEELREEPQTAGKAGMSLQVLGHAGASYLMFLASDGQVPVHLPLIKLLDRLGLIPKTTSLKKARVSVDGLVGKGKELEFTLAIHEVLERWEDETAPIYMTVPCLQATDYGKKSFKDRSAALAKAEAARKREEERVRKEDERERKRVEAEAKKRTRELEPHSARLRRRSSLPRGRRPPLPDAKRKEAEARRAEVARKKEAARKQVAAKKIAAKKAAEKKAAAKKAAAQEGRRQEGRRQEGRAAKKAAAKKKPRRQEGRRQEEAAAKKAAGQEAAAKKAAAKKKPAAKKAPAARRPPPRRSRLQEGCRQEGCRPRRRPAKKKPVAKKAASRKKPAAKKKASKKSSTRRR